MALQQLPSVGGIVGVGLVEHGIIHQRVPWHWIDARRPKPDSGHPPAAGGSVRIRVLPHTFVCKRCGLHICAQIIEVAPSRREQDPVRRVSLEPGSILAWYSAQPVHTAGFECHQGGLNINANASSALRLACQS